MASHRTKLHSTGDRTSLDAIHGNARGMRDLVRATCLEQPLEKTQLVAQPLAGDEESVHSAMGFVVDACVRGTRGQHLQD